MKTVEIAFGFAAIVLASPALAATISVYTDEPTFTLAVGSTVVEDFGLDHKFPISTGVLKSDTNLVVGIGPPILPGDIVEGVTFSTDIGTGFFFNIDLAGGFVGGFLDGLTGPGNGPLTVSFDVAQSAFGFITNGLMASFDLTINFTGGGSYSDSFSIGADPYSFFGFASDTRDISSVLISGTAGGSFTFAVDDFRFTDQPAVSPVPLPAAAWMLMAGLGGLGALRMRTAAKKGKV